MSNLRILYKDISGNVSVENHVWNMKFSVFSMLATIFEICDKC